jgi:hypothetical protein
MTVTKRRKNDDVVPMSDATMTVACLKVFRRRSQWCVEWNIQLQVLNSSGRDRNGAVNGISIPGYFRNQSIFCYIRTSRNGIYGRRYQDIFGTNLSYILFGRSRIGSCDRWYHGYCLRKRNRLMAQGEETLNLIGLDTFWMSVWTRTGKEK